MTLSPSLGQVEGHRILFLKAHRGVRTRGRHPHLPHARKAPVVLPSCGVHELHTDRLRFGFGRPNNARSQNRPNGVAASADLRDTEAALRLQYALCFGTHAPARFLP